LTPKFHDAIAREIEDVGDMGRISLYASQCEPAWVMKLARAREIRRRLGGPASTGEPVPFKPRTMHWKTYRRLVARCVALENAGLGAAATALRRWK
jgi:hypothetical protein